VDGWFATQLAPRSAAALRHAAAAARHVLASRVREVLPVLERLYLDDLMRTQDAVEGIEAFLARRAPHWTDR
jgi:cyclohexa-1,5-dienecarbonyl-CoA hydratase